MCKFLLSVFIILVFSLTGFSQSSPVYSFDKLNSIIEDANKYDKTIEKVIDSLQQKIKSVPGDDLLRQYDLSNQLYEHYKVFKYDSAYAYARKCQKLAYELQDHEKIAQSSIILNFTLLSSGLFKETADSLKTFAIGNVNNKIKADYYALQARYYYDLADYARDNYYAPIYNNVGSGCLDSALSLYPDNSFSFSYYTGLKDIRLGNMSQAQFNFHSLISKGGLTDHEFALVASTLSDIYIQKGSIDSAIALLIDAAIADIKSSTKETSAMYNLAQLLYKKGDIKNASKFIEYAIKDAAFYGARQRKVQLIAILPLIEAEKISQVESQKKALISYSAVMTVLLIAVIFLAYTVYKQVSKLKRAQIIISEAREKEHEVNEQLAETNNKLSELNNKLSEANKIKEEYIGYFFNANSEFFNRIERFKRSVEQKLVDRKIDEIKFLVNNINLRKEKEDLLKNFDKAFLRLFPHFVKEFNLLFRPEDRIQLKDDEILNTDLRIFALIRMGIHDIGKIAQILEYSVNTINTYKTKIKNKSTVPNEEFELKIMQIETLSTS